MGASLWWRNPNFHWKVEPKTLESQIKCHTYRFLQCLISLSEKKNQINCVFHCFFCWIPYYTLGDPKGSPPLLTVTNHFVLVPSAQSQAAPAYRDYEKITEKPQRLWGTVIIGGALSLYLLLHSVLRQQGFCSSVLCTAICIAWWF